MCHSPGGLCAGARDGVVGGSPLPHEKFFEKVLSRLALDVTLATTRYYERICLVSHPDHVIVLGQSQPMFPSCDLIH